MGKVRGPIRPAANVASSCVSAFDPHGYEDTHGQLGFEPAGPCRQAFSQLRFPEQPNDVLAFKDMVLRVVLDAFDGLRAGVALVDGSHRVLASNIAADSIFALEDGMRIQDQRLLVSSMPEADRLGRYISIAATPGLEGPERLKRTVFIPRPSGKPAFRIAVAPQTAATCAIGEGQGCLVAVFITDPDKEVPISLEELTVPYGLTRAEARVAKLVIEGKTPREAADELDVSYNTVRTHLTRILEKSGTDRQVEFVRMFLVARI